MAVSGTCTAFSTSFPLFCLSRFGCGMALSGIALNSFSLSEILTRANKIQRVFAIVRVECFLCFMCCQVVEWIPTNVRTIVGTITGYFYTVGQLLLTLIAYKIRDWRWLTLAVSLPFYVFFLYSW